MKHMHYRLIGLLFMLVLLATACSLHDDQSGVTNTGNTGRISGTLLNTAAGGLWIRIDDDSTQPWLDSQWVDSSAVFLFDSLAAGDWRIQAVFNPDTMTPITIHLEAGQEASLQIQVPTEVVNAQDTLLLHPRYPDAAWIVYQWTKDTSMTPELDRSLLALALADLEAIDAGADTLDSALAYWIDTLTTFSAYSLFNLYCTLTPSTAAKAYAAGLGFSTVNDPNNEWSATSEIAYNTEWLANQMMDTVAGQPYCFAKPPYYGTGGSITSDGPGTGSYHYRLAWGDCPAGCLYSHTWNISVSKSGFLSLTSHDGDSIPAHPDLPVSSL